MARKDPTFTADDIHRLYCNNLTGYERAVARAKIVFQPCSGDPCGYAAAALRVLKPVCLLEEAGIFSVIARIPYVGGILKAVVSFACTVLPFVEFAYDVLCTPVKPALPQLPFGDAVQILLDNDLPDLIEDLVESEPVNVTEAIESIGMSTFGDVTLLLP